VRKLCRYNVRTTNCRGDGRGRRGPNPFIGPVLPQPPGGEPGCIQLEDQRNNMKIKFSWRSALAVPLPAITSMASWLVARQLVAGATGPLILACVAGVLSLAAIGVVEHEETRRAGQPYKAEHLLARAEARNRIRYARAQTRRFGRLPSGEQYAPDSATDLIAIMRGIREHSVGDSSTTRRTA
jgi:hypothetical protein